MKLTSVVNHLVGRASPHSPDGKSPPLQSVTHQVAKDFNNTFASKLSNMTGSDYGNGMTY